MSAADQELVLEQVRTHARALAAAITAAETAGVSPAILLPELITILRESGFTVPALPFGRGGNLGA